MESGRRARLVARRPGSLVHGHGHGSQPVAVRGDALRQGPRHPEGSGRRAAQGRLEERSRPARAGRPPGQHARDAPRRHARAGPLLARLLLRRRHRRGRSDASLRRGGGRRRGATTPSTSVGPTGLRSSGLAEGAALALSPDGGWALAGLSSPESHFMLLPSGTGEPRPSADRGTTPGQSAAWMPDGEECALRRERAEQGSAAFSPGRGGRKAPRRLERGHPDGVSGLRDLTGRQADRGDRSGRDRDPFPIAGGEGAGDSRRSSAGSFPCASRPTESPSSSGGGTCRSGPTAWTWRRGAASSGRS